MRTQPKRQAARRAPRRYASSRGALWEAWLFTFLLLQLQPAAASPGEGFCDPDLRASQSDAYGYRQRGDRCEGVYVRDVGSQVLRVISLTRTFEEYRADGGGDLRLTWTPWNDAPVKLRAEGARPRLHYRMDTTQPGGASPYRWSPRLLAALAIDRRSLGVTAWTQQRIGGEDANVYLPLSVAQGALPPQARVYRVVAVPGRELREVYVSMWAVDGEGRVQGALIDGRPVGHGYYPVGAGVPIEVPQPEAEGIYKLELGASLPSGGAYSVDLLFHHAKN